MSQTPGESGLLSYLISVVSISRYLPLLSLEYYKFIASAQLYWKFKLKVIFCFIDLQETAEIILLNEESTYNFFAFD